MAAKRLYQELIDYLLEQINEGNYSYDRPFCTEKQLEEQFQVSNITAKRAITELEQKGLLYRKRGVGSFVARGIQSPGSSSRNNARIYAALCPFDISPCNSMAEMIQVVNARLNPRHGYVSFYTTDRDKRQERKMLQQLLHQSISGLIYYPNTDEINLDLLEQFFIQGIPVVVLDKSVTAPFVHNVTCDNFEGARQMTDYLISKGHIKIAFVSSSGISKLSSVCARLSGYFCAMRKAALPLNQNYVVTRLKDSVEEYRPIPSEEQKERICQLLTYFLENGVTAVECENDGLADTMLNCCQKLSIRVPEDLSISGFDGRSPKLGEAQFITTVFQNEGAIAEQVADILLRTMDADLPRGETYRTPIELQIGGSTGVCCKQRR